MKYSEFFYINKYVSVHFAEISSLCRVSQKIIYKLNILLCQVMKSKNFIETEGQKRNCVNAFAS